MSQRLTRKEIKRDEFAESLERSIDYLREHGRQLAIGAAVVVGLVLAALAYQVWRGAREDRGQELLASAIALEMAGDGSAAAFQKVRSDAGGTRAAAIAGTYLAGIAAADGDTARARELWQEFIDQEPDHLLATAAQLNLIALDRADGRGEELVNRLRAAIDGTGGTLPKEVALFELGVTLENLGRMDEARAVFDRLITEHPTSTYAGRARIRVAA